ncbi:hypothetical protein DOS62_05215, partial [Staphylococcus felis]
MFRLIEELKYCAFNFAILLFGYLTFYRPANESRELFQKEYGDKIKVYHLFNDSYRSMGIEHIKLYIFAIIIFIIVIIIGVIIIIKVNQTFFSPYIQIFISLILIIMALY